MDVLVILEHFVIIGISLLRCTSLTIWRDPRLLEKFTEAVKCPLVSIATVGSEERQCILAASR